MPAALIYEDGTYTAPFAITLPEFSAPFPRVNADYVLTQDFVCNLADFSPLALDTPHPDYAAFILVREDQKRDLGGGKVQWTRTYAKVPTQWQDAATINFVFPGLVGSTSRIQDPRAKTVNCKIVYDYFLVGAGGLYSTPQDIPVNRLWHGSLAAYGVDSITNLLYLAATGISVPTVEAYKGWIADGVLGPDLVAQDSAINQWMGNIYARETRYIKAQ